MCQYVISSAFTPRSLIICRRPVIHFPCIYARNKRRMWLYTILVIIFYNQISIIGYLSLEINSLLKWKGVTRKNFALHFKEMKCKTNTLTIVMHQMHNSTTQVSSVKLTSKKLEIQKESENWKSRRMKTKQSPTKLSQIRRKIELSLREVILCFEMNL
jgi:hypothetical protein